ncbi:hypothetical protein B0H34DRAFT_796584 [Crassisporium funariophilum]|nr:hypothetical protein B0H34DRAFT_796584 [Crassisporium funariophilum]
MQSMGAEVLMFEARIARRANRQDILFHPQVSAYSLFYFSFFSGTGVARRMSRSVSIDDTDSNIQYSGSDWVSENGAVWDNQGNYGATWKGSQHRTTASEASFSYSFDGSNGGILGTNNIKTTNGVQDPTWECLIDGVNIPIAPIFPYVENQWTLCAWNTIPAGRHTITVKVKSNGQAFMFDRLLYHPSPGVNVQNADIGVSYKDSALDFSSGWSGLQTIAIAAPAAGAFVNFPFYGTGISWYGIIPNNPPTGSSTATYSFDGQPPTTFTVRGNPGANTQYNQRIFSAGGLQLGQHTLTVTSQGSTSLTPLNLAGLTIENSQSIPPVSSPPSGNNGPSNPPSSGSTTNSSSKSSTTLPIDPLSTTTKLPTNPGGNSGINNGNSTTGNTGNSSGGNSSGGNSSGSTSSSGSGGTGESKSATPIGAVVGGVVGGIALIILIAVAYLYRRRRRRTSADFVETEYVQPFSTPTTTSYHDATPSGSGSYSPLQMSHVGNSRGVLAKQALFQSAAINGSPNTIPSFYPNPSSPLTPLRANHYPSAPSSEASAPSSTGSEAPLLQPYRLQPNRSISKHQESSNQLSQPSTSRDVFHEDSGIRLPPSRPPTEIVEHPPMYTPA